jgi:predicted membrane chloride channel (bestrophin family)
MCCLVNQKIVFSSKISTMPFPFKPPSYFDIVLASIQWDGTVLPSIAPILLASSLECTIVAILYQNYKLPICMDDKLLGMIGSALAMLLAFRTNRAFDRYNRGSELWTILTIQVSQHLKGRVSFNMEWVDTAPGTSHLERIKAIFS